SAAGGGTGPPAPPNGQPSQSICAPRRVVHWLCAPSAPANKNSACTSQLHKADQPFAARHPHQSAFPRRATASLILILRSHNPTWPCTARDGGLSPPFGVVVFMAGKRQAGNPLGARAMYLSGSVYRIHEIIKVLAGLKCPRTPTNAAACDV